MLEVSNLSVNYRHTWAIKNVSFQLQPGQITALLGANGAGKSTLFKAVLGLVSVRNGTITWAKQPVCKQLKKVAYVPQRSQIDWDYPITVEKVVMMGRNVSTGWFKSHSRQAKFKVNQAIERVGMGQYRQRQISELSGGQQQRVFLARAIAQEADLLLLDEPFSNVDQQTETIIFEIFAELKAQNKTVLVISHDLSQTLDNYDQLLLLNKKLVASGSPAKVLTSENINQTYDRHFASKYNLGGSQSRTENNLEQHQKCSLG